jgi:hypothetical protein
MPTRLTNDIINAAILGFESQKTRIDQQISELKAMLSGEPAESAATPAPKRKKFSASARKRMKEAQQLRWAKIRGESTPAAPAAAPEPAKSKRRISEEGMKRIIAATKKRWRLAKAAKAAKAQTTPAKKAAPAAKKAVPAKKAAAKKAAAKKPAASPAPVATQSGS